MVQSQLKTSNHLRFYMFFNFRAYAKHHFFFLLGSYLLSTSASPFLHISFTFTTLFLHTSLLRASSIISRHLIILISIHFSVFVSLIQLRPFSTFQTWGVWHKASAYSGVNSSNSSAAYFVFLRYHKVEDL